MKELKRSDLVDVHRTVYRAHHQEAGATIEHLWIPAVVEAVDGERFAVRSVTGERLANDGSTEMWLNLRQNGNTWK